MITVYGTDGTPVLRNLESKNFFETLATRLSSPMKTSDANQSTTGRQQFLPHLTDREMANAIFAEVEKGDKVEKRVRLFAGENNSGRHFLIIARLLSLSDVHKGVQGVFVLVVEVDVTQLATLHEENSKLRTATRASEELVSDIAHNVKAPLNGIVGLIETMQSRLSVIFVVLCSLF